MQDIMFATMLYVAMICFVCCLRYQPDCAATVETATAEGLTDESQQTDINQGSTAQPELLPEPVNILVETEASSHTASIQTADTLTLHRLQSPSATIGVLFSKTQSRKSTAVA